MEAGLPEEDSELSREGQLLHDYSAHPEYNRSVLEPKQQDLLALADQLAKDVIDKVEGELDKPKVVGETREQTLEFQLEPFGTPDFVRIYDTKDALVIDLKMGYNVVERAELNLQLRTYAVLVWDASITGLRNVFVAIVQPRAPHSERITIAKYTPQDIEDSRQQIVGIIERTKPEDAPLVPGDEQCRYCKAKLICPAFREAAQLPAVITPDTQLSVTARRAYLEQKLAELNDVELGKVLQACKLAKLVSDPASDEIRKRIIAGGMTDFKLAKESHVRSIADVRKAMSLLSLAGMSRTDLFECVTEMALGKLAEKVRKTHPGYNAKQADDWINKKLASVLVTDTRKSRILKA